MPDSEVSPLLPRWQRLEFLPRENRVRTDIRAEQLGIMFMMMIVGTLPDTGGGQHINAEARHDQVGQPRPVQDGMMLMIMIDNEHAHNQQAGKYTAAELQAKMRHEQGARQ